MYSEMLCYIISAQSNIRVNDILWMRAVSCAAAWGYIAQAQVVVASHCSASINSGEIKVWQQQAKLF